MASMPQSLEALRDRADQVRPHILRERRSLSSVNAWTFARGPPLPAYDIASRQIKVNAVSRGR